MLNVKIRYIAGKGYYYLGLTVRECGVFLADSHLTFDLTRYVPFRITLCWTRPIVSTAC